MMMYVCQVLLGYWQQTDLHTQLADDDNVDGVWWYQYLAVGFKNSMTIIILYLKDEINILL